MTTKYTKGAKTGSTERNRSDGISSDKSAAGGRGYTKWFPDRTAEQKANEA